MRATAVAALVVVVAIALGASCTLTTGGKFDGTGGGGATGAECETADTCPGVDDECTERSCNDHTCGFEHAPIGKLCGDGQQCNGSGLCISCFEHEDCAPGVCDEAAQDGGERCQLGACVPVDGTVDCTPYVCNDAHSHCLTACSSHDHCAADHYCQLATEQCVPTKLLGVGCIEDGECDSERCADGVCCEHRCDSPCEACLETHTGALNGYCEPPIEGTDPDGNCPPPSLGCGPDRSCVDCGTEQLPPSQASCSVECSDGCSPALDICYIDCDSLTPCATDITCPDNMACVVTCDGYQACKDLTITCPSNYDCSVICSSDTSSCNQATINCPEYGKCLTDCQGATACNSATVTCGKNTCEVHCTILGIPTISNDAASCQFLHQGCKL